MYIYKPLSYVYKFIMSIKFIQKYQIKIKIWFGYLNLICISIKLI